MEQLVVEGVFRDPVFERPIVMLRQPESGRVLPIRVGAAEADAIARALAAQPHEAARERPPSTFMLSIEDLVDGRFVARIRPAGDSPFDPRPVRLANALKYAVVEELDIVAGSQVLQIASLESYSTEHGTDSMRSISSKVHAESIEQYLWVQEPNGIIALKWRARVLYLFALFVIGITLRTMANTFLGGSKIDTWSDIFSVVICWVILALVVWGCLQLRTTMQWKHRRLLIFPYGLKYKHGRYFAEIRWSAITGIEPIKLWGKRTQCLIFTEVRFRGTPSWLRVRLRAIPIEPFDSQWRQGRIGELLRRFAPEVIGIPLIDPDGGSAAF